MTIQIAVRLPDALVEFIDTHTGMTRAAVVRQALEQQRDRERAMRDLTIMQADPDDGLDGLAEWAARIPRPDLD